MCEPLSLAHSPLRGAMGPDGDDVATAANDNAAEAANDNATADTAGAIPMEPEMQNVTREIALEEDEAATGWRGLAMLVLISIAAHAALFGGLGGTWHRGEARPRKRPPTEMTVTVKPPPRRRHRPRRSRRRRPRRRSRRARPRRRPPPRRRPRRPRPRRPPTSPAPR